MFSIILISISVAVAAVFTALYLSNRKFIIRLEAEKDSLLSDIAGVRSELARCEASAGGRRFMVTAERLKAFLENERGYDCKISDDGENILFSLGEEMFHIDCHRLPQQVILRKGYSAKDSDIDWDVLEAASLEVNRHLIMVKMHVDTDSSYDYMIVSMDRTMDSFIGNFDSYMSIIRDAERMSVEKYHEIHAARESSQEGCVPTDQETESLQQKPLMS